MTKETETKNTFGVDKGLVARFIEMSPGERLQANDNAARTILELKSACRQQKCDQSDA